MTSFTPGTVQSLAAAGWQPGRKVSTFQYRARLTGDGYAWFPQVEEFLREFGGLAIRFVRNGRAQLLSVDAYDASDSLDRSWMTDNYALRIGRQHFCVLGTVYTHHVVLFMDDLGRVYGCFDDLLWLVGQTGAEAIEVVCSGQPLREIA